MKLQVHAILLRVPGVVDGQVHVPFEILPYAGDWRAISGGLEALERSTVSSAAGNKTPFQQRSCS